MDPGMKNALTHMLARGDWLKPEKVVTPGVPKFLHPLPADADDSRLTFARWLADPKSPTTARVFVNRFWQAYFGDGLLETPEDFGVRAPAVSHPQLLDWLAVEFMQPSVLAPGESSIAPALGHQTYPAFDRQQRDLPGIVAHDARSGPARSA